MSYNSTSAIPFPRELYDLVTSNLRDDLSPLRNLSLVDRASADSCQVHLFRQVTLRSRRLQRPLPPTATPCSRLYQTLRSSPHLSARVKELCIDDRVPDAGPRTTAPHLSQFEYSVRKDKNLPRLLEALNHLTSLKLIFNYHQNWQNLPPSLRYSIQTTLSSANLVDLTIKSLQDFPLSTFRRCSGLNRLCLLNVILHPDIDEADIQERRSLESLAIILEDPQDLFEPTSPFDLSHLQEANIALSGASYDDFPFMASMLERTAHTLVFLGLHICACITDPAQLMTITTPKM